MRHEKSGGDRPCRLAPPAGGRPLEAGYRTAIREIMQRAWFVIPDYDAVRKGAGHRPGSSWRSCGAAATPSPRILWKPNPWPPYARIILQEVVDEVIDKQ